MNAAGFIYITTRWPSGVITMSPPRFKPKFQPLGMIDPESVDVNRKGQAWVGDAGDEPPHKQRFARIGQLSRIFEIGSIGVRNGIGWLVIDRFSRIWYNVGVAGITIFDPASLHIIKLDHALDYAAPSFVDNQGRVWALKAPGAIVISGSGHVVKNIKLGKYPLYDHINRIAYDGARVWYEGTFLDPHQTYGFRHGYPRIAGWLDPTAHSSRRCAVGFYDSPYDIIVATMGRAFIATWPTPNTITVVNPDCQTSIIALPKEVYITAMAKSNFGSQLLVLDGFHRTLWRVKL